MIMIMIMIVIIIIIIINLGDALGLQVRLAASQADWAQELAGLQELAQLANADSVRLRCIYIYKIRIYIYIYIYIIY